MDKDPFLSLIQLANKLKLRELFEEPSTYEDEDESFEEFNFGRLTQR